MSSETSGARNAEAKKRGTDGRRPPGGLSASVRRLVRPFVPGAVRRRVRRALPPALTPFNLARPAPRAVAGRVRVSIYGGSRSGSEAEGRSGSEAEGGSGSEAEGGSGSEAEGGSGSEAEGGSEAGRDPAAGLEGAVGPGEARAERNRPRAPVRHRHSWVRGPAYDGMEDNDIRGFLDGRYALGWNQPSQIHVRLGRTTGRWARGGERDFFRVLQRWDGIRLPSAAAVTRARLELRVEEGPGCEVEVFLYSVHRDWNPGGGGMLGNNNSAPAPGEAWWNEPERGTGRWGLPGAGYAADDDPEADTPVSALAGARVGPGDGSVAFESEALASYVDERMREGAPLLFLLKLSDYLEDLPGSVFSLYSANHGDDRNLVRRPRLELEWESPAEIGGLEREVLLENGRRMVLPRLSGERIETVAASFEAQEGAESPRVLVRGGNARESSPWRESHLVDAGGWSWAEVRLEAVHDPVVLGESFVARMRDTWVRTGPPEAQEVPWTFVAPSGRRHRVRAEYQGGFGWEVRFIPDELGRWFYEWSQTFISTPYRSPEGSFDVIAGDEEAVREELRRLAQDIRASSLKPGTTRMEAFAVRFARLQRAAMRHLTPEQFPMRDDGREDAREDAREAGADGGETGALIDDVREAITGRRPRAPRLHLDEPVGRFPS